MISTNFYSKYLIVMLISITFQMEIISQNYHPLIRSNTFWDVMKGEEFAPCFFISGGRYFFEGDTILEGLHYSIVRAFPILSFGTGGFCKPYEVDGDSSYVAAFMREDTIAKKVFTYDEYWGDNLIYDYSLGENDTLVTNYLPPVKVDSIRYVTLLNGEQRKIFHFYWYGYYYYTEGIGGSMGLCYPIHHVIDYYSLPGCVIENDVPLINLDDGWGINCYPYVGINELTNRDRAIIYPNPINSGDYLTLTTDDPPSAVTIIDIHGKNVDHINVNTSNLLNENKIKINNLKKGIYFVKIQTFKNLTYYEKFIIKH